MLQNNCGTSKKGYYYIISTQLGATIQLKENGILLQRMRPYLTKIVVENKPYLQYNILGLKKTGEEE